MRPSIGHRESSLAKGDVLPSLSFFPSRLLVLNLAAASLIMCAETVLQRGLLPIHLTHVTCISRLQISYPDSNTRWWKFFFFLKAMIKLWSMKQKKKKKSTTAVSFSNYYPDLEILSCLCYALAGRTVVSLRCSFHESDLSEFS